MDKPIIIQEEIEKLSSLFKVLSDTTRVKILYSIQDRERCVGEICDIVGMNKSAVSHQLRVLRDTKLVKSRKNGKEVYYSFDDEHISTIFKYGIEHVNEG